MKHPAILLLTLFAASGHAEVASNGAGGFEIHLKRQLPKTPDASYRALGQIGRWWSDQHTWSGHAQNLSLPLRVGGCLCERWPDGEVEHGHVIYAAPGKLLRLVAPLGPLQALAVNAVLSFEFAAVNGGSQLNVTFRVSGDASVTGPLSAAVDGVITEQVDRYVQFLTAGKPAGR